MLRFSKLFAVTALVTSAVVAAITSSATAVAATADSNDSARTVKVFYYSLNDMFMNQLSNALQDRALANRIKVMQYDANSDLMRQVSQIQTAVSVESGDGCPIIVNPVDTQNGVAALRAAQKANVPVIFFNRQPSDNVLSSYDKAWYVGTHPLSSAHYQAEVVAKYFKAHPEMDKNKDGVISYVMLKGESGHQDTDARSNGFVRSLLEQDFKLDALASVNADWSQSKAQNQMTNIIDQAKIENIELVVANNDAMALGAVLALQAAGYNLPNTNDATKTIPVVGIDGLPDALDAVERGTMIGTVFNDYNSTADVIMRIAAAYLNGNEVTEELVGYPIVNHTVDVPYFEVTNDNISNVK